MNMALSYVIRYTFFFGALYLLMRLYPAHPFIAILGIALVVWIVLRKDGV